MRLQNCFPLWGLVEGCEVYPYPAVITGRNKIAIQAGSPIGLNIDLLLWNELGSSHGKPESEGRLGYWELRDNREGCFLMQWNHTCRFSDGERTVECFKR